MSDIKNHRMLSHVPNKIAIAKDVNRSFVEQLKVIEQKHQLDRLDTGLAQSGYRRT